MNEESQEKKQREEQYKALVDFFKEDSQIKNTLMSIAPKASDEYNEDSRMEYLEQLYSELNNIEFKVMGILKNFNMESVLAESYKEYFKKAKENFSELGYGSQHENLSKIYQKIFTDMKPQLVEKAKNTFAGYTFYGGLSGTSRIINEVGSINELLHIMHSSIINDQDLLQSMPIIGTKKNEFSYNIVLYGEENKISQEIFEKFPKDLDVGDTDISSTHSIPFHSLNPSPLEDAAQPSERKRKEATDAYSVYEEIIKDNIEYDYLIQDRYLDRDRIEEILALILETVCTKRRTIRIAGDDHPAELVKAKFMKLNSEHIRFVLDCMQENTTKIRNIKQYMKAALFNAPSTIGSYYTSLVSHDMYGGHTIQSARSRGIPDYTCNEGESL